MTKMIGLKLETGLDQCVSKACQSLGMTKSGFIRYCVMTSLKDLSLMSEKIHEDVEQ